jgi:hypothetical protein
MTYRDRRLSAHSPGLAREVVQFAVFEPGTSTVQNVPERPMSTDKYLVGVEKRTYTSQAQTHSRGKWRRPGIYS